MLFVYFIRKDRKKAQILCLDIAKQIATIVKSSIIIGFFYFQFVKYCSWSSISGNILWTSGKQIFNNDLDTSRYLCNIRRV